MKYFLFIFALSGCALANAQHWPTYTFQHDSVYRNAGVKTIQWKADSARSSLLFEVEIDPNGRITKLAPDLDPTTYYKYDENGKLIEEWDWDGTAVFTYDERNRVVAKTYYSDDKVVVKTVSITYNPTTVTSLRYEEGKLVERKKYVFETPTTIKEYTIEKGSTYGEIKYTYINSYNEKGQIIKTIKTVSGDVIGEATYQYDEKGLLNTITIPPSFSLNKDALPTVEKLIYTYY